MLYHTGTERVKSSIRWAKFGWNNQFTWDFTSVLSAMEEAMFNLKHDMEICSWHDHKSEIKNINICLHILKRQKLDDYIELTEPGFYDGGVGSIEDRLTHLRNKYNRLVIKRAIKMQDSEREYLFKMLRKHLHCWWC